MHTFQPWRPFEAFINHKIAKIRKISKSLRTNTAFLPPSLWFLTPASQESKKNTVVFLSEANLPTSGMKTWQNRLSKMRTERNVFSSCRTLHSSTTITALMKIWLCLQYFFLPPPENHYLHRSLRGLLWARLQLQKLRRGSPPLLYILKGWGRGCGLIACNMSIDRHQVGQSRATGLIIINDGLFGRNAHHSAVIKDAPSIQPNPALDCPSAKLMG